MLSVAVLPVLDCSCIAGRINGFRIVLKYVVAVGSEDANCFL